MNVLITGADGFIAKNLIERLNRNENIKIFKFEKNNAIRELNEYINEIDFIFHLAGINRPEDVNEFYHGNCQLTKDLVAIIEKSGLKIPILLSSSTQVEKLNDYGKSKLEAEKILEEYSIRNSVAVYIYRLPNVFGKWSRPGYNTVIATWCYNIINNMDISITDKNIEISLVYIDDVISKFLQCLFIKVREITRTHYDITTVYKKTLGEISDLLFKFKEIRTTLIIPEVGSGFERALYSTYLSFIPGDQFSYPLIPHNDERGSFFEIIKTLKTGQFSVVTSLPGVTRGNHYHNTKNEKFIIIKGEAVIRFRKIFEKEIFEYRISDKKIEVVDIPIGYVHNITNTGDSEMLLLIWANELFDSDNPDTYHLEV